MKRYWDHTESERAKLTEEQVEKFLSYELMEKGILQVEPLKIEQSRPISLPTRRVFILREEDGYRSTSPLSIAFDTIEQAESACDAIQYIRETGYQEPACTRPVRALQVVAEEMPTADAVAAQKAALDEAAKIEQRNDAARREFEQATKRVSEATSGIWSDWRECQAAEAKRQKIRETLAEYRRMADGNDALAREFLLKVFSADEICGALGDESPQKKRVETESTGAPAPGGSLF